MAHLAMPRPSRLEIFPPGYFPFHDDPDRFVEVVERFIDDTVPAEYDQAVLRELLRHGVSERAVSGSLDTRVAVSMRSTPTNAALPDRSGFAES